MKKTARVTYILFLTFFCALIFSACTNITQHELTAVGRYNLTDISGLTEVTAETFEDNYIVLSDNNTFEIKNEAAGYTYNATGKWNLDGETLTLKLSGLFAKKETHTLKNGTITITGTVNAQAVVMTFTKSAA